MFHKVQGSSDYSLDEKNDILVGWERVQGALWDRIMTREQMIEELVEYEFTQVTMVEVVQMYIKLQREFMDQTFSDDEIADRYNDIFGEEEVVH